MPRRPRLEDGPRAWAARGVALPGALRKSPPGEDAARVGGERARGLTMFMTVRMNLWAASAPWYCTMSASATTSVSTVCSLVSRMASLRSRLPLLGFCFSRKQRRRQFPKPESGPCTGPPERPLGPHRPARGPRTSQWTEVELTGGSRGAREARCHPSGGGRWPWMSRQRNCVTLEEHGQRHKVTGGQEAWAQWGGLGRRLGVDGPDGKGPQPRPRKQEAGTPAPTSPGGWRSGDCSESHR